VRDSRYRWVIARRYCCFKCQDRTRLHHTGPSPTYHSDTLKGLSVLLYILGLSYQGVKDFLDSLGCFLSKTTVYKNVQAACLRGIRLCQIWAKRRAGHVQVLGLDFTHLTC
jgi:hypothetical protein